VLLRSLPLEVLRNNIFVFICDPLKMQYYNVRRIAMKAVKTSNNDVGGRKFEMSNMAYIVRGLGYIKKTSKMWKKR
jgi:Cu(I)/Ag(I) efflux system membrane protein CusA/SilA